MQKMNMKMEIRKKENGYDTKRNILRKILKEFEWFEWFEWFGPSPIEPFNSGPSSKPRATIYLGPVFVPEDEELDLVKKFQQKWRVWREGPTAEPGDGRAVP